MGQKSKVLRLRLDVFRRLQRAASRWETSINGAVQYMLTRVPELDQLDQEAELSDRVSDAIATLYDIELEADDCDRLADEVNLTLLTAAQRELDVVDEILWDRREADQGDDDDEDDDDLEDDEDHEDLQEVLEDVE